MKMSPMLAGALVLALPLAMGAQCGGESTTVCQDSEGRNVPCPDSDAGTIVIHHDAGPRPDAGSADTGRNLPFEAECTPGEQGGCRFACLDTPDGWPDGTGGFCTKPCANAAECGDENLWRCAEVDAEYLCVRDHDVTAPEAEWVGANASRELAGAQGFALEILATDDRSVASATVTVNDAPVNVVAGEQSVVEGGVARRFSFNVTTDAESLAIVATVADQAGQTVELTKTVTVDRAAPTVELVQDQNLRPGGCVPSPSSVAVTASDNVGLAHVRIMVDDETVGTIMPQGDNTQIETGTMIDYRAAGIVSGTHRLKAVAEDLAGNTAEDSVSLRIMTNQSSGNPCD